MPSSVLPSSSEKLPVSLASSLFLSSRNPPIPANTSTASAFSNASVPSVTTIAWYSVSSLPPGSPSPPNSVTEPNCTRTLPLAITNPNASSATEPCTSTSTPSSTVNSGSAPPVSSSAQFSLSGSLVASVSPSETRFTFTAAP